MNSAPPTPDSVVSTCVGVGDALVTLADREPDL